MTRLRALERLILSAVPAVVGLTLALAMAHSAPANAAGMPWWHLAAEPVPTYLHPGLARREVQEITVTPGEAFGFNGAAFEVSLGGISAGSFANEPLAKELTGAGLSTTAATEGNIQKALEGEEFYGKGGVTVTEVPPGTGGKLTFVVTTKGPPPLRRIGSSAGERDDRRPR
jgi:hypothetical protein